MTEKDKIIQDLRRDNDRLHTIIRQYIEGVKNLTEENKQLRREIAEIREQADAMIKDKEAGNVN
ncbi:MAG: hypothetical protein IJG87_02170 [Ruminococcus sp.]|nr:hypothetical protein [Ruminococcus sp.]